MGLAHPVSLRSDTCCLSWLGCTKAENSLWKEEKEMFSTHECSVEAQEICMCKRKGRGKRVTGINLLVASGSS